MLKDHIQQFMEELSLPLTSKGRGVFEIPLVGELTVTIHELDRGLLLECELADLPASKESSLLPKLMHANLFSQLTRGAVLGLNREGNRILLSRHVDEEVSYTEFNHLMEDFFNVAIFWQQEALQTPAKSFSPPLR